MAIKIRRFDRTKEKVCAVCHKLKPLSKYHLRSRAKDGRERECKLCVRARVNRYYAQHREEVLQRAQTRNLIHSERKRKAAGRVRKRYFIMPPERMANRYLKYWKGRDIITGKKIRK